MTAQPPTPTDTSGLLGPDPEPWPEPVDGAQLLDAMTAIHRRHLALPLYAAEAVALWELFAHTHDAHQHSPRLAFISPVPECGKTTALDMLSEVDPDRETAGAVS
jgi:hypothetical protein